MKLKNENGFGVVGFLVLLPLLLSILAAVAVAAMILRADAHLKHECRVSVLNSQRSVANALRDLMELNTEATAAREDVESAQEQLEVAKIEGNGPAIALAEINLSRAKTEQQAVRLEQQALIVKAKAETLAMVPRAETEIEKGLFDEARSNGVVPPRPRLSTRAARFALKAEPEGDPTPDYSPGPRFSETQTVDVNTTINVADLMPAWLRNLLPTQGLTVNSHCQATIQRQEDNQWIETLNEVR